MIIELPDNFSYKDQAIVEDGVLKILNAYNWKRIAYEISVAVKGKKCWFCGKELEDAEVTIDHLYPQSLGGLTIPENIAPTCSRCNNNKSNLTEVQYRHILAAPSDQRGAIRRKFLQRNEAKKAKTGYVLPKDWITRTRITNILVSMDTDQKYPFRKFGKIEKFYKQYQRLPYPIVVDRNGYLLDGFLIVMFAKSKNISNIPTIRLENVEVVIANREA